MFKADIERLVHPGGVALNLEYQFSQDILQALILVQRFVEYYKRRNKTRHPFCATFFQCGATVVPKPRGEIQRIWTVDGENECCPVFLDWIPDYDVFWNWLNYSRVPWDEPLNTGQPPLQAPLKYAEDVTDKGYRLNFGRYTFDGERIYIGHRIESTETVIVQWLGIRRKYEDTDLMPYDDATEGDENDKGTELKNVVAAYVRAEDLRKNRGKPQEAVLEMQNFNFLLAEMKYQDKKERRPKVQEIPAYDQLTTHVPCGDAECQPPAEE